MTCFNLNNSKIHKTLLFAKSYNFIRFYYLVVPIDVSDDDTVSVSTTLLQSLSAEGESGTLLAYAETRSGVFVDVSSSENLSFDIPESFTNTFENGRHIINVAEGAENSVGRFTKIKLQNCRNEDISGFGAAFVNLTLPNAEDVSFSNKCKSQLTHVNDRASDIFRKSAACQLSTVLNFPSNA